MIHMKRMSRKLLGWQIILLVAFGSGCCISATNWLASSRPALIPFPASYVTMQGSFELDPSVQLFSVNASTAPIASYFCELINRSTGWNLTYSAPANLSYHTTESTIWLVLDPSISGSQQEGYSLIITQRRIEIRAPAPAGLFYGLQTLRQLLPATVESTSSPSPSSLPIPCCIIRDSPRFSWRGFMLDEARYFHGMEFVKKMLDLMALFKLNTFHWHLTDDQGWRIQILQYINLTTIGAWRNESQAGGDGTKDGIPHGGYYTQDQIREIVKYASDRSITIVPEIEMPGHSRAALASYPWLGCTGGPYSVGTSWGIYEDVYCAGKEST